MKELVSVIMPAYNSSLTIKDSIKSVIVQSYKNIELIIVDDCSEDNTVEIIQSFSTLDPRIKLIRNMINLGVAKSRNKAIADARGEYVAFLDSDDIWCENKLKFHLKEMKKYKCNLSCSSYYTFSGIKENIISVRKVKENITYQDLLKSNQVGCSTVICDMRFLNQLEFKSIGHEDYELWLNITKSGLSFLGVQEPLSYYRVSSDSLSSNKFKMILKQWNIYRKYQDISLLKSVYYTLHYMIRGVLKRI
ncbi:TPA: glycosyltransferase family 2 protein [Vibrio cholerae]|nr:glycosyltransferase family 2 protein [Vibrio cholerae]